jgi:hypothetical protein
VCGLCGTLTAGPHWTQQVGGVQAARHRLACLRFARALARGRGVTVAEWQGHFVVSNGRGRSVVADDLAACWAAVEQLSGRVADPLEPAAVAALREAACASR